MFTKGFKRLCSFMLAIALVLTCMITGDISPAYAAETKTNPAKSMTVTYDGGAVIVGKSIAKTDLTVMVTLKDGTKEEVSNFTIKNKKVTSENFKLTVTYKNKAGEQLSAATNITGITDFKSIKATLKDDVSLDYGDKITKDMFDVQAVLSNGKTKELDSNSFSISNSRYDAEGKTSMRITVSATNAEGKEKRASVTVKALKAVKSIEIKDYKGSAKDVGDELSPEDFEVEGITYGGERVAIKDFTLDPSSVEKTSVSVKAIYENSLGKTLKSKTKKIIAEKCIEKIESVEYIGSEKQLEDSIATSDFKVTGKTYGKESVEITDFEINTTTIKSKNQSVTISYTNTAGRKLTKSVKLTADNKLESMYVELRRDNKKMGDELKLSDFKITGTYHDGSTRTLSKNITMDKTAVNSINMTVTFTCTDNPEKPVTATCTFKAEDTVSSDDGVSIVCTKTGQYQIGDVVSASDFTGTAKTAAGQTVKVEDISIKSGGKLTGKINTVVVSYRVGDVRGTKSVTVVAGDSAKTVEVTVINESAYAADAMITGNQLAKMIRVDVVYASGERDTVSNIMTDKRVKSIKAEGNVNLKTSGAKYKLQSGTNRFTLVFEDADKGISLQTVEFTIKPDFKKSEVAITQNKKDVYLDAGNAYTLSSLVDVKDAANGINLISKSGTSGYPTVTATAGSGAKVAGQVVTFTKGTSGKLTISTSATNQYVAKKETFTWKIRSLTAVNASAKAGTSYAATTFVKSNDSSSAIKMEITSGAGYASVSGNKLVAKKAGTVKIKLTQGATSVTATVKITN